VGLKSTGTARNAKVPGEPPLLSRARRLVRVSLGALLLASPVYPAAAQGSGADGVRISGLSDVSFGSITSFAADSVRSQSVCLYAKAPPADNYRITASGSGSGGNFSLSSGTDALPYDVQWSNSPGQTTGIQLSPNVPLTGQPNAAKNDDCSKGPATTASLIVILRSSALASALAGSYSGSLTLLVAPE
jgi:hypothetical protein